MNRTILPALLCAVLATAACGGESAPEQTATTDAPAATQPPVSAADTSAANVSTPAVAPASGALLDPNAASREELLTLPHMTPALADAIVAGRPHADMRAVDRVLSGALNEQQRDELYARLWKPLDLNSATAEEIELIPGINERMRHEFEEYRPYRSMEQFRTEIGKYVDDAEVTRLERYVTIAS